MVIKYRLQIISGFDPLDGTQVRHQLRIRKFVSYDSRSSFLENLIFSSPIAITDM
jgi:hypothetical protein